MYSHKLMFCPNLLFQAKEGLGPGFEPWPDSQVSWAILDLPPTCWGNSVSDPHSPPGFCLSFLNCKGREMISMRGFRSWTVGTSGLPQMLEHFCKQKTFPGESCSCRFCIRRVEALGKIFGLRKKLKNFPDITSKQTKNPSVHCWIQFPCI